MFNFQIQKESEYQQQQQQLLDKDCRQSSNQNRESEEQKLLSNNSSLVSEKNIPFPQGICLTEENEIQDTERSIEQSKELIQIIKEQIPLELSMKQNDKKILIIPEFIDQKLLVDYTLKVLDDVKQYDEFYALGPMSNLILFCIHQNINLNFLIETINRHQTVFSGKKKGICFKIKYAELYRQYKYPIDKILESLTKNISQYEINTIGKEYWFMIGDELQLFTQKKEELIEKLKIQKFSSQLVVNLPTQIKSLHYIGCQEDQITNYARKQYQTQYSKKFVQLVPKRKQ